jgi:predicted O-methyltransferase YrrM
MPDKNRDQKTVIVLGNGRSGTSMVAGILQILGVAMDARKRPNPFNPKGDFESIDAHKINCKIYNLAAGKNLGDEPHWNPPPYEKILAQKDKVKEDIQRFVLEKSKNRRIWGWKNPKTTLTIELFLPYLSNPHFVIVTRNPIKVAQSTARMTKGQADFYKAFRLLNFYNNEMLNFLERHPDLPRLFLAFEDIIEDPIKEAKKLADFLGLELTKEKKVKIKKFVIPKEKIQIEKRKAIIKNFIRGKIFGAVKILREEGILVLLRKCICKFRRLLLCLFLPYYLYKIKTFRSREIDKLIEASFKVFGWLIKPYQIPEEISQLLKILKEKKPRVILEIGTANGGTLFLFSRIVAEDAMIISIDLPSGSFGGGYPKWKIPIFRLFKLPKQKLYLIRKNSHDPRTLKKIKEILKDQKIDFLFIDGDHTYKGVKKDFELYHRLVKKGGLIAFHDIVYGSAEYVGGVPIFWQEIKRKYKHFEIVKDWKQGGYGIGIIFIK